MFPSVNRQPASAMWALLALISVLSLAGCGKDSTAQAPGGMPPPEVVAATVTRADLPLHIEYMAQTAGSREVQVRARVGGILLKRAYEEGKRVKEGDLMFVIDPAPFQAALTQAKGALAQAEARLAKARRDQERMAKLFKEGVVSQKDRDDSQTDLQTSAAEVDAAKGKVREAALNLEYTKVTAPITGITSKETRSEGSLVVANSDTSLLTTMTRLDPLYVNFSIPGPEFSRMRKLRAENKIAFDNGDFLVTIALPDGGQYSRSGRINFTDTSVDTNTGVVKLRAEFANPEAEVLPGQFVRVRLNGARLKDVIAIPQAAVLQTQQGALVWVVGQDNVVQPRPVALGELMGNSYLVESGLEAGERIITEGVIKVRPGVQVAVRGEATAAQGAAPAQAGAQGAK
ncbi:MAG: efflux RND transporter periplasmic adaptor subunit [Acidobacteriota bacterium]